MADDKVNNVNVEIKMTDEQLADLIDSYIRFTMSSGSYEIFTERKRFNLLEAAGYALQNESMVSAVVTGMVVEKAAEDAKPVDKVLHLLHLISAQARWPNKDDAYAIIDMIQND